MTDKLQNEEIKLDMKTIDDMGEMNEDELNAVAGGVSWCTMGGDGSGINNGSYKCISSGISN